MIDYEDYPDGFTIIGVDLTAALPSDVDVKPAPLEGELSVKLWFENELAQAVSMLVFGVYSDEIIIDQNRFVRVSWSNMAVRLTKGLSHDELEVILKPVIASYQSVFNHG